MRLDRRPETHRFVGRSPSQRWRVTLEVAWTAGCLLPPPSRAANTHRRGGNSPAVFL